MNKVSIEFLKKNLPLSYRSQAIYSTRPSIKDNIYDGLNVHEVKSKIVSAAPKNGPFKGEEILVLLARIKYDDNLCFWVSYIILAEGGYYYWPLQEPSYSGMDTHEFNVRKYWNSKYEIRRVLLEKTGSL